MNDKHPHTTRTRNRSATLAGLAAIAVIAGTAVTTTALAAEPASVPTASAASTASASTSAPMPSALVGKETPISVDRGDFVLRGTLLEPPSFDGRWVALLIAGSGPTDRNGNSPGFKTDTLRLVAEGLARAGIASVRYDKRGIGESANLLLSEEKLRFTDFSDDAAAWVEWIRRDGRFRSVAVIGHSEGSALGMLVAQAKPVDAFVSLEGPADDLVTTLERQLKRQLEPVPPVWAQTQKVLASLKRGETTTELPQFGGLQGLFRASVQPYLISAGRVVPVAEIAKLKIPVAIVQGGNDIQVLPDEGERLKQALPDAQLRVFPGMNHALKDGKKGDVPAYREPVLTEGVVEFVAGFVKGAAK